jgi:hypothetical protein
MHKELLYQFYNLETLYFDNGTKNALTKTKSLTSSLIDTSLKKTSLRKLNLGSTSSLNSCQSLPCDVNINKYELDSDTVIEFYSTKSIDPKDLESIILFLENPKRSGGSDIVDYNLSPNGHLLKVKYEKSLAKQRVFEKRKHEYKSYKLIAHNSFKQSNFNLNDKMIILQNIPSQTDHELIRLYGEYLVINDNELNDVEDITKSNLFKDTFYIKFKLKYDSDKLKERLKRRKFCNRLIEFMETYNTKTILVKLFDLNNQPIDYEFVELYFDSKKCGPFTSIRQVDPFVCISYESEEMVKKILESSHTISKRELQTEYLYNFDLLNNIEKLETTIIKRSSRSSLASHSQSSITNVDSSTSLINSTNDTTFIANIDKYEDAKEDKELKFEPPFKIINQEEYDMIKILFYFEKIYFDQLNNELGEIDGDLIEIKTQSGKLNIKIECNLDLHAISTTKEYEKLKEDWLYNVNVCLKKFFDQFTIKSIRLKNPDETIPKIKDYIISKNNNLRLNLTINEDELEICGFKRPLDDLINFIEEENKKQSEQENQIVEDVLSNLELYQLRILYVTKYKQQAESLWNVEVNANPKDGLVFIGKKIDIKKAKDSAKQRIQSIKCTSIPADIVLLKFVMKKEAFIVQWLRKHDIIVTLKADESARIINIYYIDQEQAKRCINELFNNAIKKIEMDKIIPGSDTHDFTRQFDNYPEAIIMHSDEQIFICGFEKDFNKIYSECLAYLYSC